MKKRMVMTILFLAVQTNQALAVDLFSMIGVSADEIRQMKCAPQRSERASPEDIAKQLLEKGFDVGPVPFDFSSEELETISFALNAFPKEVFPENHRTKIYYDVSMPAWGGQSGKGMALTKLWRDESFEAQVYTVIHEAGHLISRDAAKDIAISSLWMNIAGGWHVEEMLWSLFEGSPRRPESYVSPYARFSPSEDWAESVAAYRIAPSKLKAASLEKYQLIKNGIFGGVEYDTQEKCATRPRYDLPQDLMIQVLAFFGKKRPERALRKAMEFCLTTLPFKDSTDGERDVLSSCMAAELISKGDPGVHPFAFSGAASRFLDSLRDKSHQVSFWINSRDRSGKRDLFANNPMVDQMIETAVSDLRP